MINQENNMVVCGEANNEAILTGVLSAIYYVDKQFFLFPNFASSLILMQCNALGLFWIVLTKTSFSTLTAN